LFSPEDKARALRAAAAAAKSAGLSTVSPTVLHCARHLSILLPEHSLIARVMPATAVNIEFETRELAVSRFLLEKGAPVVAPPSALSAGPYVIEDLAVTLWPRIAHNKGDYADEEALGGAARSLQRVHEALAAYPGQLPSYKSRLEECHAELQGQAGPCALPEDDRRFLLRTYECLTERLARLDLREAPIHGDAHLGNVFFTSNGPLWTDFETACIGPREWDVAALPYLSAFPELDTRVLSLMDPLRSVCVCVWCSALADDAEKRDAARDHLQRLRQSFG
jgi:Ser/Thr protein kinase RdoA (MazF antagonist)